MKSNETGNKRNRSPIRAISNRFHVKKDRTNEHRYVICDFLTGSRSIISQVLLEDPMFDISHWYAEQRSRALRLTGRVLHQHCMGDVISIIATKLITDGISSSYPCTNPKLSPQYRFNVCPTISDTDLSENYQIDDLDLEIVTTIPKGWLEDPTFDFVGWYRQHLDQRGLFESRYYDNYQALYTKLSPTSSEGDELVAHPPHNLAACSNRPENSAADASKSDDPEPDTDWDDLPDLEPVSSDELENDPESGLLETPSGFFSDVFAERIKAVLTRCQPFPGDDGSENLLRALNEPGFIVTRQKQELYCIYDRIRRFESYIHVSRLRWEFFSIGKWFAERCAAIGELSDPWYQAHRWLVSQRYADDLIGRALEERAEEALRYGISYPGKQVILKMR
jgi:hypothetical protein